MAVGRYLSLDLKVPNVVLASCLRQQGREFAFDQFQEGFVKIMVTTFKLGKLDLNLQKVKWVILWDMPMDIDEYTLAAGRVGRTGHRGFAKVFFDKTKDEDKVTKLRDHLLSLKARLLGWLSEVVDGYTGQNTSMGPSGQVETFAEGFTLREVGGSES